MTAPSMRSAPGLDGGTASLLPSNISAKPNSGPLVCDGLCTSVLERRGRRAAQDDVPVVGERRVDPADLGVGRVEARDQALDAAAVGDRVEDRVAVEQRVTVEVA